MQGIILQMFLLKFYGLMYQGKNWLNGIVIGIVIDIEMNIAIVVEISIMVVTLIVIMIYVILNAIGVVMMIDTVIGIHIVTIVS